MILAAGTQLGPYVIFSPLGAGGMGEVWRARDTRLNREVAIKVLPASFAHDADRLRRFKQEALATSALNHPNILTVYDIGDREGMPYIVAELLDGEELRAQLNAGPLSARKAIEYARQIAAGLAAAHEKGIVHRDLKPENLFVTTDGRVKILDFGLAKLRSPQPQSSEAPTQKMITDPGTVMGTVGYMAPEQVCGKETDNRSDIFAFGVILYEMLSGQRPFSGDSGVEVMNAILKEDPPELGESNKQINPQLTNILRRCLEKRPGQRFQSASDLGFALEAVSISSSSRLEMAPALSVHKRERLAWLAIALLLGILGFAGAYFIRDPVTNDARVMKFSIPPPEKASFESIAVSPDGRHLAFTAATGGKVQLWVRAFDSIEARVLTGTQGARSLFWSPDSRFIGFFADDKLKKIEATGGPVQTLCDAPLPLSGAWSRDGVILFGQSGVGLSRISEKGGEVTAVTTLDRSRQEIAHGSPTFLPDGRHFFFDIASGQKVTRGVYLGSLDGRLKRQLLEEVTGIKYTAAARGEKSDGAGWLVFGRDGALLARPFDIGRLDFTGDQFLLSDKVGRDIFFDSYLTFSLSDNGVLVFDPSIERRRRQYRWVDRRGQQFNLLDVPAGLFNLWLSPDEKRFIADRTDPQTITFDLWLFELAGGTEQRFTIDPADDFSPIWSPDGSRIVWASTREDVVANLYQRAANLAGEPKPLWKSDQSKIPTDWSRDGRFIIYHQYNPKTKFDVWVFPLTGSDEAKPLPVVQTEANEVAGALSPDGHWLAYTSNASGRHEIYVQSFPDGGGKRQVSTGGGNSPRWRRDGRELFYYAEDGKLMAAPVRSGESFETGATVSLFEFRAGIPAAAFTPYVVTDNGQRFLINTVVETEPNAPLTVVVNWANGIKK
jgi:eukaryotic-like serine/threonine-protein kinase